MKLRIFLSSPGDVSEERLRAHLIVQKLARDYRRFADIEIYLWEYEPMLAQGHFQDAIALPSASDILVLILYSRLGTPLPERSPMREYKGIDGRTPVTGTEWEFEEALSSHRKRGAPDLLAYRRRGDPGASLTDAAKRAEQERQWNALEAFWKRHFADQGMFLAGSANYDAIVDFEKKLEADLVSLIERRIKAEGAKPAGDSRSATWLKGSPFVGLPAYEFSDAPIFFGRDRAIRAGLSQLAKAAQSGTAFLLIRGASGAGKSSLARAGLLPALVAPKAVPGVGLWRRVVFKLGANDDPYLALAEEFAKGTENRDEIGIGLSELLGQGQNAAALANHLRTIAASPAFPFKTVLGGLAASARKHHRLLDHEEARLVLVIDQLEELFTRPSITPDDRVRFIQLLSGLAKSGLVWIIATLRADFWSFALETPELLHLTEAGACLDLAPPDAAEIDAMIRQPARIAGLAFETDPESGLGLDAQIAAAAKAAPGALPLLSVLLDTLYRRDIGDQADQPARNLLKVATYRELKGLEGAISQRAEESVKKLEASDPKAAATFTEVLRRLVTVTPGSDAVTSKPAQLDTFERGSPQRRLIDAFLAPDARLFVADGMDSGTIRLAHEALIAHWQRAVDQIAADRRDLETRAQLESSLSLYQRAPPGRVRRKALLSGLSLELGRDLVERWDMSDSSSLGEFVSASSKVDRWRRNKLNFAAIASMVIFAGLLFAAYVLNTRANEFANEAALQRVNTAAERVSLAVAQSAVSQVEGGAADAATMVALAALPKNYSKPERPAVPNAELALAEAVASLRPIAKLALGGSVGVFSDDGSMFALGGKEGTVWLYRTDTWTVVGSANPVRTNIVQLAFSPDGRMLAIGPQTNKAFVYEVEGLKQLYEVSDLTPDKVIVHLAFSLDSKTLHVVVGGGKIVSLTIGSWLRTEQQTDRSALLIQFPPDRSIIATSSIEDRQLALWSSEDLSLKFKLANEGLLLGLSFSPNSTLVATAGESSQIRLWNTQTGKPHGLFTSQISLLEWVCFINDDVFLAGNRRSMQAFRIKDRSTSSIISLPFDTVDRQYDPVSGAMIFSGTDRVEIFIFNPSGLTQTRQLTDRGSRFSSVALDPRNGLLAGIGDGVTVWRLPANSGLAPAFPTSQPNKKLEAWFSSKGKLVATYHGETPTEIVLKNAKNEALTIKLTAKLWDYKRPVFSTDGKLMAAQLLDTSIRTWDTKTGEEVATTGFLGQRVEDFEFSPDGGVLAVNLRDNMLRLLDSTKLNELQAYEGIETYSDVEFSNDGHLIKGRTNVDGRTVTTLFDRRNNTQKLVEPLGDGEQTLASFLSNDWLVIASRDGTAIVFDPAAGRVIGAVDGHKAALVKTALSKDERVFASADEHGRVLIRDTANFTVQHELRMSGKPRQMWLNNDGTIMLVELPHGFEAWSLPFERRVAVEPNTMINVFYHDWDTNRIDVLLEDGRHVRSDLIERATRVISQMNWIASRPQEVVDYSHFTTLQQLTDEERQSAGLSGGSERKPLPRICNDVTNSGARSAICSQTMVADTSSDTTIAPSVDPCDALTANPFDPDRKGPGVSFYQINAEQAVAACQEAKKRNPAEGRFGYQLARALNKLGKTTEAMHEFEAADKLHYPMACVGRALLIQDLKHDTDWGQQAIDELQRCADLGLAIALVELGRTFNEGEGVPIDKTRAIDAWSKAAAQNNPRAHAFLSDAYAKGDVVPIDIEGALRHAAAAVQNYRNLGMNALADEWQLRQGTLARALDPHRVAALAAEFRTGATIEQDQENLE